MHVLGLTSRINYLFFSIYYFTSIYIFIRLIFINRFINHCIILLYNINIIILLHNINIRINENITERTLQCSCAETFITYGDTLAALIFHVLSIVRTLFGPCKSPYCLFLPVPATIVWWIVTLRSLLHFAQHHIFAHLWTNNPVYPYKRLLLSLSLPLHLSIHPSIHLSICSSIFLSLISYGVLVYQRPFARALTTERQARAARKTRERGSLWLGAYIWLCGFWVSGAYTRNCTYYIRD